MIPNQRLPSSLTPLDAALRMLLDGLAPVASDQQPLAEALGCIAAAMPPFGRVPARDMAAVDGWALASRDLVGASSYSPLPLPQPPAWVEAGDAMPAGCDCVVDADLVDASGPLVQVVAEAIPGQGVRRAGQDVAGGPVMAAGQPLRAIDLLAARAAGLQTCAVRRPRLHLVNVPTENSVTASFVADQAAASGIAVTRADAPGRDVASIVHALDPRPCDVVVTIGGTGVGRGDAAIAALATCGRLLAHGIALQPGRTAAIGRIANVPVIALPGAPDQALAVWWTVALPVLDRLSGRQPRKSVALPLARKIASGVGINEIVLVRNADGCWLPLASGELALEAIARADAWLAVPAGSEGYAAGTPVDAYMMTRD